MDNSNNKSKFISSSNNKCKCLIKIVWAALKILKINHLNNKSKNTGMMIILVKIIVVNLKKWDQVNNNRKISKAKHY